MHIHVYIYKCIEIYEMNWYRYMESIDTDTEREWIYRGIWINEPQTTIKGVQGKNNYLPVNDMM